MLIPNGAGPELSFIRTLDEIIEDGVAEPVHHRANTHAEVGRVSRTVVLGRREPVGVQGPVESGVINVRDRFGLETADGPDHDLVDTNALDTGDGVADEPVIVPPPFVHHLRSQFAARKVAIGEILNADPELLRAKTRVRLKLNALGLQFQAHFSQQTAPRDDRRVLTPQPQRIGPRNGAQLQVGNVGIVVDNERLTTGILPVPVQRIGDLPCPRDIIVQPRPRRPAPPVIRRVPQIVPMQMPVIPVLRIRRDGVPERLKGARAYLVNKLNLFMCSVESVAKFANFVENLIAVIVFII